MSVSTIEAVAARLTISDIARRTGVHRQTVYKWLYEEAVPPHEATEVLRAIERELREEDCKAVLAVLKDHYTKLKTKSFPPHQRRVKAAEARRVGQMKQTAAAIELWSAYIKLTKAQ